MKKLRLNREALAELSTNEMRDVAGGTVTYTCFYSLNTCYGGASCICSIGGGCTNTCTCDVALPVDSLLCLEPTL